MKDYFYKFFDEAQAKDALSPLGMTYEDDDGVVQFSQGGHTYAAWSVGELQGYSGWHYNLRVVDESFDVSSLSEFEVNPGNPKVIWA